jgi:hypothetical protein
MGTSEWHVTIDDVPVVERVLRLVLNEMVLVLVIVIGARVVSRTDVSTITITSTSTAQG